MTTTTASHPTSPSPPRHASHVKKGATRFEKEVAASGAKADDYPGDPKNIGPWRIGRTIGKGAAGRVKIAKHSKTGQFAAVKILPKSTLSSVASRLSLSSTSAAAADVANAKADKYAFGIEREIVIMKLIDHPNVMSLHDVWETDRELFLILEYVSGGELFDYLVSRGRLPPSEALRYFQQIIHGVDYCHRFNICHRDLKPENLLLDADKNIKIADFGMAALEMRDAKLETSCGSPHYASPEIVAGLAYHGAASDIWSCGIILFALLTGRLPFDDENIRILLQKVKLGKFVMPPDMPSDAKDLIGKMLVVDPEKRITMPEILLHPFFLLPPTSSTPRPVLPIPPTLSEIARPVASSSDIERDILKNLRTLWHGAPEKEIVRALLSEERNWEKAFYTLLVKYKQKHLENLGGEVGGWGEGGKGGGGAAEGKGEGKVKRAASERKKDRSSDRDTAATSSRRTRPASTSSHAPVPTTTPGTPTTTTTTIRKPVPREGKIDVPEVQARASSTPTHSPVIPAPVRPASTTPSRTRTNGPAGPRPQSVHLPGTSPVLPEVGGGTPSRTRSQREQQRSSVYAAALSPTSTQPPQITFQEPSPSHGPSAVVHGLGLGPVSPSTVSSPSPGSPLMGGGAIVVPTVGDAALQKFLNDMASELTALRASQAQASSSSPNPSPSPSPVIAAGQFANEERERDKSESQHNEGSGKREREVLRTSQAGNVARSGTGPKANEPKLGRKASAGNMAMPGSFVDPSAKRKSKPAPLDLSPLSPQMSSFLSPTLASPAMGASPTPLGGWNFSSAPPSPALGAGGDGGKQSWFSNLFNWKPATATLISSSPVLSTRSECSALLSSFSPSMTITLDDPDGWGVLRCSLTHITDLQNQLVTKPVRFRVEFLPHSATLSLSGSGAGGRDGGSGAGGEGQTPTVTSITLVQEKGALSAFKIVCARLRQEWSLCEINSPGLAAGSRFSTASPNPNSPALEAW